MSLQPASGKIDLIFVFTYSEPVRHVALLLLLLVLGSCGQGPVTACVTSQTRANSTKPILRPGPIAIVAT
jgi:hypothetical protein